MLDRRRTLVGAQRDDDLDGVNVLIGDNGKVVAAREWDRARRVPREHELWTVVDHAYPRQLLDASRIDEVDRDRTQLKLGLLRGGLGDLASRVVEEVDRPGVGTWGFARLAASTTPSRSSARRKPWLMRLS